MCLALICLQVFTSLNQCYIIYWLKTKFRCFASSTRTCLAQSLHLIVRESAKTKRGSRVLMSLWKPMDGWMDGWMHVFYDTANVFTYKNYNSLSVRWEFAGNFGANTCSRLVCLSCVSAGWCVVKWLRRFVIFPQYFTVTLHILHIACCLSNMLIFSSFVKPKCTQTSDLNLAVGRGAFGAVLSSTMPWLINGRNISWDLVPCKVALSTDHARLPALIHRLQSPS